MRIDFKGCKYCLVTLKAFHTKLYMNGLFVRVKQIYIVFDEHVNQSSSLIGRHIFVTR